MAFNMFCLAAGLLKSDGRFKRNALILDIADKETWTMINSVVVAGGSVVGALDDDDACWRFSCV